MIMGRSGVVVVACGLVLLSAGCGKQAVAKHDVETRVAKQLAAATHQPVPTVTCPGDLPAKVGAGLSCTLTPQGSSQSLPVRVVVTSIKGSTVNFHAQVGTTLIPNG